AAQPDDGLEFEENLFSKNLTAEDWAVVEDVQQSASPSSYRCAGRGESFSPGRTRTATTRSYFLASACTTSWQCLSERGWRPWKPWRGQQSTRRGLSAERKTSARLRKGSWRTCSWSTQTH